MKNKRTGNLVSAAMLAALITVATTFVRIPTGINSGYIHLGDAIIFLAAMLLPLPYAMCAAAIGGSLADLLAGAAIWAPATFAIKALNVLPFYLLGAKKNGRLMNRGSAASAGMSAIITLGGYFVAEMLLYNTQSAVISLPFNAIQGVGSAVAFCAAAYALDCAGAARLIRK